MLVFPEVEYIKVWGYDIVENGCIYVKTNVEYIVKRN